MAKDTFPFATLADGGKEVNFKNFLPINLAFLTRFLLEKLRKNYLLENSDRVAKGKISCVNVTHDCKDKKYEIRITFEDQDLSTWCTKEIYIYIYTLYKFGQKEPFQYLFFKVDSQNPNLNI